MAEQKKTYAEENLTEDNFHPFAGKEPEFTRFPSDEFSQVRCTKYEIADLPPSKLSKSPDPVPSCRFLFAGYAQNRKTGDVEEVRKFSDWMRISWDKKASIVNTFDGFDDLKSFLESKALFGTPLKIFVEDKKNSKGESFQKITKIKRGTDDKVLNIVYDDEKFPPTKMVKAFGSSVPCSVAIVVTKDGIKRYFPNDMVDEEEKN